VTEDYQRRGAVGIKLAHAYWRTLACDPVSERKAASVYQKALGKGKFSEDDEKAFQDHIIYWLASLCAEMGLVFQIHTGVQSTWGHVPYSDPLHLLPLLRAYKSVRFDLFHAGYPYSRELGMLGKHYPNVWLNMAWMYVITMEGSRQTLREWFDLVPAYRLLGFGSDVAPPEFIYGHLVMARSCVADVLAEKVARDFLSLDAALDLARKLFHDNPVALYGLK
jgi:predicted TIM-barrel fold metal-dependent hydrolase